MGRGDTAFDRKDFEAALEAYKAADAIMKVPTTGIAVAKAHAQLGHLLEARDLALSVARTPVSPKEPGVFAEARKEAAALAEALAPRIPSLTVTIRGSADRTTVTIDGAPIPPGAAGAPRALNPGKHLVVATAPGYEDARAEVVLAEGASDAVELELKRPGADSVAATSSGGSGGLGAQRTWALVAGGVGVVGVGVGSFLGLSAKSKYDDAKARCTDGTSGCDAEAASMSRDARSQGNLATIVFGVGMAGLVTGGVLWFTAPSADAGRETATGAGAFRLTPLLGNREAGVVLSGRLPRAL